MSGSRGKADDCWHSGQCCQCHSGCVAIKHMIELVDDRVECLGGYCLGTITRLWYSRSLSSIRYAHGETKPNTY